MSGMKLKTRAELWLAAGMRRFYAAFPRRLECGPAARPLQGFRETIELAPAVDARLGRGKELTEATRGRAVRRFGSGLAHGGISRQIPGRDRLH